MFLSKLRSNQFLFIILFSQLIVCFITLVNAPIARQVILFLYLTFLPGFIIIQILKLEKFDKTECLIFSVGFSVVFLIFVGLIVNEFGFLLGAVRPLSTWSLLAVLNSFILIGGILIHIRKNEDNLKLGTISFPNVPIYILLICFPALSIVGAIWVDIYANNLILLIMILAVSFLFIISILSDNKLSPKLYPLIVLVITISLVYHSSLTSKYLLGFGSDVMGEYYAFRVTERSAYWNSTTPYLDLSYGRLNAMLSVTILPTIYSILLNIDSILVFKVLYPFIFSCVPLSLYKMWSERIGEKYAFMSSFFFTSYFIYTELLGLNRQMIAELFFVLLLFVLGKNMKPSHKILCFIFFSFGLVVSHYGLALIFLFFISFSVFISFLIKNASRKINVNMAIFFFTVMFVWYIFVSRSSVLDGLVGYGEYVYSQLRNFFNLESRGPEVLRGIGLEAPPTIWNAIGRVFAYATEFLIVVGFAELIRNRSKRSIKKEHFLFIFLAMAFLLALILVPGLSRTMNITRFYHVLLFFLAPLCIIGAETIVKFVLKRNKEFLVYILTLIVLVPYFLFQTSFVYEITGSDSWSLPLSKYRMNTLRLHGHFGYTDAYSVNGAQWISMNMMADSTHVYADFWTKVNELRAYGVIYPGYIEVLSNTTEIASNGIVYLDSLNVIEKIVVGDCYIWNSDELLFLSELNVIYSNGGSEIYAK